MTATDDTTATLVSTGISIVLDDPAQILERGLRVEDVFARAGVSRATFYRRFVTKDRYLGAVVDALVATGWRTSDRIVDFAAGSAGGDIPNVMRAVVDRLLAGLRRNPTELRRLLALAFGTHRDDTRQALIDAHRLRDRNALALFDALVGTRGVALRKPFSTTTFPVVLTAVLDGLQLRRYLEPDAVPAQLITDVFLALTNATLRAADDDDHVHDALAAVTATPRSTRLPTDPRSALIGAARTEFSRRGFHAARYEAIAEAAGVPVDGARKLFATKTHFIVGALRTRFVGLEHAISDDVVLGVDEIAVLENHFRRCAELVLDEPAFMDALIAVVSHDTYSDPEGLLAVKEELNLPGLITPVLESGQRAGTFAANYPPFELAAMMTNTLLLRCFTRRTHSPAETAAFTRAMVVDGLRAR